MNAFCKCRIPYISVFKQLSRLGGTIHFILPKFNPFLTICFFACILTQEPNCTGAEAGEPRSGVPAQQPGVQPAAPAALLPPAAWLPTDGVSHRCSGAGGGGGLTGLLAPAGGLV